jgi:hypothetical protein
VASVDVLASDLSPERLPRICVKTGEPADGSVSFRFLTVPIWVALFLLGGLIAVLPVWLMTRRMARGRLPMVARARLRLSVARWSARGLMVASGLLVLLGLMGDGNESLLALAGGSVATGLIVKYAAVPRFGVRGRVRRPDEAGRTWVQLKGVHPNFVTELTRMNAVGPVPPQTRAA